MFFKKTPKYVLIKKSDIITLTNLEGKQRSFEYEYMFIKEIIDKEDSYNREYIKCGEAFSISQYNLLVEKETEFSDKAEADLLKRVEASLGYMGECINSMIGYYPSYPKKLGDYF
ncbi:hypothetical protein [Lutibacter sp.]|uniref:hypothetical protein n=1 Tax=Lutibacter sp. TaxID=1925666 RepID=UPI00356147F7